MTGLFEYVYKFAHFGQHVTISMSIANSSILFQSFNYSLIPTPFPCGE